MGAKRVDAMNAQRILKRGSFWTRTLWRPRRWKDNIKIDHRETGCEDEERMELAQNCVKWRVLLYIW